MAPYWTAEVVDELTSGYSINILEREYKYLYVEYTKNGTVKRGYMPIWKVAFAHEIGHTLGLDHPPDSNEEETIMFLLRDQKRADYPTKVDISAVKKNYSTK